MSPVLRDLALFAATMATGLMAGLFYAFTIAVMPGLAASDDRTYVVAMRRINIAIQNGWFGIAFAGSLLLTLAAALLHLGEPELPWLGAAFVSYGLVLVLTFSVNIPLNVALDKVDEAGRAAEHAAARERFETKWVRWNLARTLLNVAAFGFLIWALAL
ncbi:membrane protein [Planotetraspora silvatica]|uniref:Membrane protein n=1 Tax=Planotetraspora silvatica TaxID=234614 RepID=A0A8J3XR10_9ACTN|nr:anthrone oxygenase family protein [Planotetraspora silvatica]GII49730.1 membrane protein [Planotetraspora silvatica]